MTEFNYHFHFVLICQGYNPSIFYPKRNEKPLFKNLVTQCQKLDIPFLEELPSAEQVDTENTFLLDAVFGFSFKGNVRAPFGKVLETLKEFNKVIPLCSVDVPSGERKWFILALFILALLRWHLFWPFYFGSFVLTLVLALLFWLFCFDTCFGPIILALLFWHFNCCPFYFVPFILALSYYSYLTMSTLWF